MSLMSGDAEKRYTRENEIVLKQWFLTPDNLQNLEGIHWEKSMKTVGFVVKASLLDLVFSWQPTHCVQVLVLHMKVLERTGYNHEGHSLTLHANESL